ncbi:hypothetical protein WICPIJ_002921 [Wickerhamomyces pijperi]|uniref:Uncharacterized protein n=1 Tax=Wickerhamomyces pijperi TaxID=599730 RepID=A0A9P8TPQ4_WICPI|nr:hypothetical protein WICPIJ_002921 [Wickerhamomyces pijperi]
MMLLQDPIENNLEKDELTPKQILNLPNKQLMATAERCLNVDNSLMQGTAMIIFVRLLSFQEHEDYNHLEKAMYAQQKYNPPNLNRIRSKRLERENKEKNKPYSTTQMLETTASRQETTK